MNCTICPRNCKINRDKSVGFCGAPNTMIINKVMLHKFEEPTISVGKGSGAIFFSGCNLRCVFCQNYPISHTIKGKRVTNQGLIKIIKKLERKGAANINLVTPSHYTAQIVETLTMYKPHIPVVWNSNGYETEQTLEMLKGLVDIFLVDLKYMDNTLAAKYSMANNYVENATAAILKMRQLAPNDIIENGRMKAGLIVRQLVLPSHTTNSINCLKFVLDNLGANTIVSIMSQYEPMYDAEKFPEINRRLTALEYKRVVNFAITNNMNKCFVQDLSSANTKFTPKFKK